MYHQDWLMRQIEMIIAFLLRLVTGQRRENENSLFLEDHTTQLYDQLKALVEDGQICQAEDLLYLWADGEDISALRAAIRFYEALNELSDARLEACNFSREEILDGLREICSRYQLEDQLLFLNIES